jgi:hypothetical protein
MPAAKLPTSPWFSGHCARPMHPPAPVNSVRLVDLSLSPARGLRLMDDTNPRHRKLIQLSGESRVVCLCHVMYENGPGSRRKLPSYSSFHCTTSCQLDVLSAARRRLRRPTPGESAGESKNNLQRNGWLLRH